MERVEENGSFKVFKYCCLEFINLDLNYKKVLKRFEEYKT